VNYIVTAKPTQLPIYPERPQTRPVASVSGSASEFSDASKQPPSTYVYRGEVLESLSHDRRYRPQPNLQVNPENRNAIESYQRVAVDPMPKGLILDGFV
jgi:hypothetical protein